MDLYLDLAKDDRLRSGGWGDAEFMAVVWPHVPALRRLAARWVGADEAEDAVQEAMVLAWNHRATLHEPAGVGGWLSVATKRVCLSLLRRRHATEELEDEILIAGSGTSRHVADLDVRQAIQELPSDLQQVIVLHCSGMSCRDLAAALELREAVARSRLRQALRRLQERLYPERA